MASPSVERVPRLLIPDYTSLSLLAMIGPEALDWLFVPGAEVWVTDMVREEALRDPGAEGDRRDRRRAGLAAWFMRNRHRLREQPTAEGGEYRKAMWAWDLAGQPPELKPSWRSRGEQSILEVLDGVSRLLEGEAVVAIVDDVKARAAIRAIRGIDIDPMATQSFVQWMVERFKVPGADTAWQTIRMATHGKVHEPEEDPVYIRRKWAERRHHTPAPFST